MYRRLLLASLVNLMVVLSALGGDRATPAIHYAVVGRIPAPDSVLWDHALVDDGTRHLYLARQGVMTLDLRTRKVTAGFVSGGMTHSFARLDDRVIAVTDGTYHQVVFFDAKSGKVIGRVSTGSGIAKEDWRNPDGLVLESKTGLLVAGNGAVGVLVLIDPLKRAVVGRITVGGHLEALATDGDGHVFVDVESRNSIAVVDVARHKLVREIPLRNCDEPNGLLYDRPDSLVMAACRNGVLKVINARSGDEVTSLGVGKGVDDIEFDPVRHVVFCPSADDGMVSVIAVRDPAHIVLTQRLATDRLARLGALDPATGRLYLVGATPDRAAPRKGLPGYGHESVPGILPGSFGFLVVTPEQ